MFHMPYSFTLTATNRGGTDSADVYIPVWYKPEIITSPDLADAVKDRAYNATITAEGTEFSMEWRKTGGTLPKGLTLSMNKSSRTCSLTGSPTETGTFTFTLELSSIAGLVDTTRTFTLKVNDDSGSNTGKPVINTVSLPDGETGTAYVAVLDATGAKPITWSKSGSFPKGLKLDEYGTIVGIPTKAKTYRFTVKATNSAGTTSQKITITITGEKYSKPKIKTSKIPSALQNEPYSAQLACKGTGPITWSFAGNKYPAGLYITEDGRISGIPKEAGKFKLKVKAENNIGSATKTYSLKVSGLVPEITNENLPSGIVGIQYTGQLIADGTDPIKWSKSGSLPSGLKLTAKTGIISGTPKKAGTYSFKVTAKNKYGRDTRDFVIIVGVVEASENTPETREAVTENLADGSPVNTPEIIEAYPEPETDMSNAEIDLCVVSGDEELRGEIYAPEEKPLTFRIGECFEGAEVYIADEAIAIEIADDGTFVLPGELVSGEFVIYVMAGNTKTIELYIVAEQEE
ncbi:MAG: putative Ig domain-containing protein [Synergistaceae bacterium]|nr:putative Ig domain-containing protein [Synergistaceae bacterium]